MDTVRPCEVEFRVATCPLLELYDSDRRLLRFVEQIHEIMHKSVSSSDFKQRVNKELLALDYPTPIHAVFVDGLEGYETETPEFVRIPVIMICRKDGSGRIYPTVQ